MIFPRREDATNKELILTIIDIQGYLSRYGKSHTDWHETLNEVIDRLEQAESDSQESKEVPQRMRGKWIDQKGGGCCCSECGRYALDEPDGNFIHVAVKSNYCPNCGAKMEGTK